MLTKLLPLFFAFFCITTASSQCFTAPDTVCIGDCGPIFYLSNDPPGTTYSWSISCGTITNDMQANPHLACFLVPGTCTIMLVVQQPGQSPDTCTETVEVLDDSFTTINEAVCEGDSVEVNGMYYTPGMYVDTIFGGASTGCDSILLITITTLPQDTTTESYLGCQGDGYSVVVNGNTYDESNPTGSEILTGSDGCDSIVNINLVFQSTTSGVQIYIGCSGDGYSVIVNNVLYDENNPTGIEVLTGANGCDSIVTITLIFNPLSYNTITYMGCSGDGFNVNVGGILFDESNPAGIVVFQGGGCDSIVTVDLQFDTLIASLTLTGNQMCASPSGLSYTWYLCDLSPLADTTQCITVDGAGCICVIVDNGTCIDTVCLEYQACELTCEIIAPNGACLGDSVLLTATTNASSAAILDWTITLDTFAGVTYPATDSIWEVFNTPGCYAIDLLIQDLGCITTCTDTICVAEKPIADLCCDVVECDTCVNLTVFLFGTPPWTIAITDGTTTDTITGITNSQYDYLACPPYDTNIIYTLLWVQDSLGYCDGGIINGTASVYLEQQPVAAITAVGDTLCALPNGFAYGWYDCANTSNLSFNQCFVPNASGCYCVLVSTLLTDCVDSACVNFILSSTHDPLDPASIHMWYESDRHSILIQPIHNSTDDLNIQLVDIQGRNIPYMKKEYIDNGLIRISLKENTPSMVIVSVFSQKFRYTRGVFVPLCP